jgi:hypothetical protein
MSRFNRRDPSLPEVTGYSWVIDAYDRGSWRSDQDFDPYTLISGKVDDKGFISLAPRDDLTEAEKRAYNLAFRYADVYDRNLEQKESDLGNIGAQFGGFGKTFINPINEFGLGRGLKFYKDLKEKNPDQYYNSVANALSDSIFNAYIGNRYADVQDRVQALEDIKNKDKDAYVTAKLGLLSSQSGWQHGQNTFERAAPLQAEIQSLIPEAQKVGISNEQINNIVSGNFAENSAANQARIVREATSGGGFNLGEFVRGVAPVAALAIGAPFLDAALSGSTAAASATGTAGATAPTVAPTGSSLLSYVGLGAEGAAPFTAAPGLASNLFTVAPSVGTALPLSLGDDLAQLAQTYPNIPVEQLQSIAEINYGLNPTTQAATGAPIFDYSTEATVTPGGNVVPATTLPTEMAAIDAQIATAGAEAAKALPAKISPMQAIQGARLASGLLSGGQQQQPQQQMAQMPQQSIIPRGQVDYSGIYNLLNLQRAANPYSLLG